MEELKEENLRLKTRVKDLDIRNGRLYDSLRICIADLRLIKRRLKLIDESIYLPKDGNYATSTKRFFPGGKWGKIKKHGAFKPQ